ncbi:MAG: hypothetical protein M1838_003285 [Thelocarpon superellum]|nr:MAG: hypothetical protein M1838_003285 [Thelocarpon superellum]
MSGKKPPARATDEELLDELDNIGKSAAVKGGSKDPTAAKASANANANVNAASAPSEQDILAELDDLAGESTVSRPHTPRLSTTSSTRSPKRGAAATPPPSTSGRTSEEKHAPSATRKSGEISRPFHTSLDPDSSAAPAVEAVDGDDSGSGSGGSWWGGLVATASAAVKTAEAAVKEIQQTEEAKRWTEQVKGNVGALRGLGGELRSRALPTFTNILHTLAPPISSHERLQIHITHDFIGYPSLDSLIYQTFSRVMAQVEGGDLMVLQRGHESSPRRGSDVGVGNAGSTGWNDGPWWRQTTEQRNLGVVQGMREATKLVRVSAEAYAQDFYAARGGIEAAAKRAADVLSESNPVRSSDIFLAIQGIQHTAAPELFGGPGEESADDSVVEPAKTAEDLISFAIYLHDPVHSITFHTLTQSLPQKWISWLDASPAPAASAEEGTAAAPGSLPAEIVDIIESGGVDPREWIAEWVEEVLSLGVGVVAQRYVARRMGVGEGGLGRGKARDEAVGAGGGEAARAI